MWRRLPVTVLLLFLTACTGTLPVGSEMPASGGEPAPGGATRYPATRFDEWEGTLQAVRRTSDTTISLGYDESGTLLAWITMIRRIPDFLETRDMGAGLAAAAQVFEVLPEVAGIWIAHADLVGQVAYYPRSAYSDRKIPRFTGDSVPFYNVDWMAAADLANEYELTRTLDYAWQREAEVVRHLRALYGERFLAAQVQDGVMDMHVSVMVRHLPQGDPNAAMEEWARTIVAVNGRFYHLGQGLLLDKLIWVDEKGIPLLSTGIRKQRFFEWWQDGMRPGRWINLGMIQGEAQVESWRPMETIRTSPDRPWWETAHSLEPAFRQLKEKVPGARVLFAGRYRGRTMAALSFDEQAAAVEQVWTQQLEAALAVFELPVAEVWLFSRTADREIVAYLDRMTYDSLRYPDPKMPPVTPDLWPHVATAYGEGQK
jgi:hypothetical protein